MFGLSSALNKACQAIKERDAAAFHEHLHKINLEKKGFDLLLETASVAAPDFMVKLLALGHGATEHGCGLLLSTAIDQTYGAKDPDDVLSCCRMLIKKGADVTAKSGGMSPLLEVAKNAHRRGHHYQLAKLLLENGANVFDLDDNGWGVLAHCLSKSGAPVELIQLFIDSGADVNAEVNIELERVEAVNSSSSQSETLLTLARRNNRPAYKRMLAAGAAYKALEDFSITCNLEMRDEYDKWLMDLDMRLLDTIKNTFDYRVLECIRALRLAKDIIVIDLSSSMFYYDNDTIARAVRDRAEKINDDIKTIKASAGVDLPALIQRSYMASPCYYLWWGYLNDENDLVFGGEFCLYSMLYALVENEVDFSDPDVPDEEQDTSVWRFFDTHFCSLDNYRAAVRVADDALDTQVYVDETGFARFKPLGMDYLDYMDHTIRLAGLYDWHRLFTGEPPAHDPDCKELAAGLAVLKHSFPEIDYSDYEDLLAKLRG